MEWNITVMGPAGFFYATITSMANTPEAEGQEEQIGEQQLGEETEEEVETFFFLCFLAVSGERQTYSLCYTYKYSCY